jgi:hypothetical protein
MVQEAQDNLVTAKAGAEDLLRKADAKDRVLLSRLLG